MKFKNDNRYEAFTLIEVILAMFIISILSSLTIFTFLNIHKSLKIIEIENQQLEIASNLVEALKSYELENYELYGEEISSFYNENNNDFVFKYDDHNIKISISSENHSNIVYRLEVEISSNYLNKEIRNEIKTIVFK